MFYDKIYLEDLFLWLDLFVFLLLFFGVFVDMFFLLVDLLVYGINGLIRELKIVIFCMFFFLVLN